MPRERNVHQATAESKRAILEAVLTLAIENGYEGTTMADVARVSGLPIGSVYWHFQNKEQLFVELLNHSFEVWKHTNGEFGTYPDLLHRSIGNSAAASRGSTDPAAFWSIGLVFAFERRLADNLARHRYLEIRAEMFEIVTAKLRTQFPTLPPEAAAELAEDLARMGRALTDGFRVAAAAGDDADFTRYAAMAADVFKNLIDTRVSEYTHA